MNQANDNGSNWYDGNVLYSELGTLLHREASSAVAIYYFVSQKIQVISGLMDCSVIDITQDYLLSPT